MAQATLKFLCEDILEEGLEIFNLSLGIVSKVEGSSYTVITVMPAGGVFQSGETFDLKDTYCREVVETQATVALAKLGNTPGLSKHPPYSGLPLEAYIGAPIKIADKVWGTLNFSSMKIRNHDFSKAEIELIESRASMIAEKIACGL